LEPCDSILQKEQSSKIDFANAGLYAVLGEYRPYLCVVLPTLGCFHGLDGVGHETMIDFENASYGDFHDEPGVRIEVELEVCWDIVYLFPDCASFVRSFKYSPETTGPSSGHP
jgi:hypothetical protein